MAALVLLAACVNLGGLFAARTADRAKELGIRIAIGSSRRRILRQLLTESVFMAIIGGAAAALLATVLLRSLASWHLGTEIPIQFLVEPDNSTFLFAALMALLTGVLFGIMPARQIWKTDPNQVLKASGGTDGGRHRLALRDMLLAIQIALCCLLVTASFVALRGLQRTFTMPLGFDPNDVTLAEMDVHLAGYQGSQIPALQQRLLNAVAAIPGVKHAAYSDTTPLSADQNGDYIFAPGTSDFSKSNAKFWCHPYNVSPDYFATTGTRILAGRAFSIHDDEHAPSVAIVNQTFARKLFGTTNVVGRYFPTSTTTQTEIIGVVEDGRYETLTENPSPAIFRPIQQEGSNDLVVLVRSGQSPDEMIPAIRQAIAGVDPSLPVFNISTWTDALSMVTFPARAATIALGILGALAMMLAVTGIFGMASYTVSKRMRELGIRAALGAQNGQILRAALGRAVVLLAIGSIAGLVLGMAVSKVLASIVYQASASDPVVILATVLTMMLVGLISATVPARRAVSVDPARLLRDE